MACNSVDFYHLAGWLHLQPVLHGEAHVRTIISRAYYSAFLVARDKAGITDDSPGVHQKVWSHYSSAGKTTLANRLEDLRLKRNRADYHMKLTMTSRDSGMALAWARSILKELGVAL